MSKEIYQKILNRMPYDKPFMFIDSIISVDENSLSAEYTFQKDEYFYQGHFADNPVTPGVILLEVMGQSGLVAFSLFLSKLYETEKPYEALLTNVSADFYRKVLPNEKVIVKAEKIYFRNNILKSKILLETDKGERIVESIAMCSLNIK